MPGRERHTKKDVEKALEYAEERGWNVFVVHHGHVWGRMSCPAGECAARISSTPTSPGNEARRLRRFVDRCEHQEKD